MRTVKFMDASVEGSDSWFGGESSLSSNACVLRNPRSRRLKYTRGNNAAARRKRPRARRSSALNRRSCSHIGWLDLEQSIVDEPPQQFREVQTKQLRLNVKFVLELPVRRVNARGGSDHLPHARTGLIQAEITLRLQIQEHGFLVQKTHQHVRQRFSAICE